MARRGLAIGLDVSRLEKCDTGKAGAYQLVDENGEKRDAYHDGSRLTEARRLPDLKRHSKRNSRLGKQGYTEVFYDILVTLRKL